MLFTSKSLPYGTGYKTKVLISKDSNTSSPFSHFLFTLKYPLPFVRSEVSIIGFSSNALSCISSPLSLAVVTLLQAGMRKFIANSSSPLSSILIFTSPSTG